jgi:hypothetical protein
MKSRSVAQNLGLMAVFLGVGMLTFTENVRTVQVLGLFASGVASGVFLARAIIAAKIRQAGSTGQ